VTARLGPRRVRWSRSLFYCLFEGANTFDVGLQELVMRGMGLAVVWREAQVFLSVFQCLFLCQDGLPLGFQFRVSHGVSSLEGIPEGANALSVSLRRAMRSVGLAVVWRQL
jgi:hypothetical protein